MHHDILTIYQQQQELLAGMGFRDEDLDYAVFEKHIPFLDMLDVVQTSSISVFDLSKNSHIYVSKSFETVLGYDLEAAREEGNAYFDNKMHPEDLPVMAREGYFFLKFGLTIPREEIKDYKFVSDYRVLNAKKQYVRVIEQKTILETDKAGRIWLSLCIMDISPDQDITRLCSNRLLHLKSGEVFSFMGMQPGGETVLTRREKEILHLVSKGYVSKEIANRLFISVNTVNTHRQRIIEKLNVSNTSAAISYARQAGLFTK